MSTKKRIMYDAVWKLLSSKFDLDGRGLSAGQVGREMGVARSTAVRWLREMVAAGGAEEYKQTGRNHQQETRYLRNE